MIYKTFGYGGITKRSLARKAYKKYRAKVNRFGMTRRQFRRAKRANAGMW